MGLKTTNYKLEQQKLILPEAYAKILTLTVQDNGTGSAIFGIQQSRDLVDMTQVLDTEVVYFYSDKRSNPFTTAYNVAKTGIFSDWEDDIV